MAWILSQYNTEVEPAEAINSEHIVRLVMVRSSDDKWLVDAEMVNDTAATLYWGSKAEAKEFFDETLKRLREAHA